jgi:glycerol-3-phosphate acyltransferase PlsX
LSLPKCTAIDAMGGDGGVRVTLPAALHALELNSDLSVTLVGDKSQIEPYLDSISAALADRISIDHTLDVISDEDKPAHVLRSGKTSSMYKAVQLLQDGRAQAMVSAGNTGALLMMGRHLLKTINGIQKPAIVASIPGATRQCFLLDVGANPVVDAQQLFEFAVMGSVLAESLQGEVAKVGLLNIGSEQFKGTEEVRDASVLMRRCPAFDYIGFIEANELFEGRADVVVCDGFVGNVTIKASAGVANVVKKLLSSQMLTESTSSSEDESKAKLFKSLSEQINPHRFNGASLLGLQGSIIKSHGNATIEGFAYAIQQAVREAGNAVPELIREKVAAIIEAS